MTATVGEYGCVGGYYGGCNEKDMQPWLLEGPIVVDFDVNLAFQHYQGGIFDEPRGCHQAAPN